MQRTILVLSLLAALSGCGGGGGGNFNIFVVNFLKDWSIKLSVWLLSIYIVLLGVK